MIIRVRASGDPSDLGKSSWALELHAPWEHHSRRFRECMPGCSRNEFLSNSENIRRFPTTNMYSQWSVVMEGHWCSRLMPHQCRMGTKYRVSLQCNSIMVRAMDYVSRVTQKNFL